MPVLVWEGEAEMAESGVERPIVADDVRHNCRTKRKMSVTRRFLGGEGGLGGNGRMGAGGMRHSNGSFCWEMGGGVKVGAVAVPGSWNRDRHGREKSVNGSQGGLLITGEAMGDSILGPSGRRSGKWEVSAVSPNPRKYLSGTLDPLLAPSRGSTRFPEGNG